MQTIFIKDTENKLFPKQWCQMHVYKYVTDGMYFKTICYHKTLIYMTGFTYRNLLSFGDAPGQLESWPIVGNGKFACR